MIGLDPPPRDAAVLLATPTIPPMTRPPYANHAPEVLVTLPAVAHRGAGGVAVAGAWSVTDASEGDSEVGGPEGWGVDPRAGYSVCA